MQGNGNVVKIIRKTWDDIKPYSRTHSTKKSKRGYDRKENRRMEKLVWA